MSAVTGRRAGAYPRIVGGLAGFLALAVTAGGAGAQTPDKAVSTTSATYDNWVLRCESRRADGKTVKACEVSTNVTVKGENGSSGIAAIVAFGRHPNKGGWQVAIQLPIIVWLPTGAKLGIGDAPPLVEASFVACRPNLCSAGATVTDQTMARLRAATADLTAVYQAQTRQTIKVILPIKGLPEALKALGGEIAK